jgi:hypothetical protein
MGFGDYSHEAHEAITKARATLPRQEVFKQTRCHALMNPYGVKYRESRDSPYNPQSTPIILASDVTGSMGMIAHELMRGGLITLTSEIYDRRPVSDPHIMVAAVGDAFTDAAPLQATQFEADISLASQIRALWLEGNGGGNDGESYSAAHLLAALKTSTDAFEKRGRKGYLFTIGDEPIHNGLVAQQITRIFGIEAPRSLSARECLAMAQRSYEVFHIVIREGYAARRLNRVLESWRPLLPGRTFVLDDHRRIAELVVSIIEITEGRDPGDVAASWSGEAATVVAKAIGGRPKRRLLPFF